MKSKLQSRKASTAVAPGAAFREDDGRRISTRKRNPANHYWPMVTQVD